MENLSIEGENQYRLELPHRNLLQAEVMKLMLGRDFSDPEEQLAWVEENGEDISKIIDTPEHEDIRILARDKRYTEAAQKVFEFLGK